jgi:hypothetical protein
MSEIAGLAGLDAVLLGTGMALLYGFGLIRSVRTALRFAGLAFVVGFAACGIAVALALTAGLAATVGQVLALCASIALAGVALGVFGPRWRLQHPPSSPPGVLALAAGGLLGIYGIGLLGRAWYGGASTTWDAWAVWIPKAKSIVLFDGIDLGTGGFASFAHPYYPPLVPGMDAVTFRFLGSIDPTRLPLQEWVLFAAFLGALAGLLTGRVRPNLLWPSLFALALMPAFDRLVGSSLADFPLAILFALAGVCAALWLLEGAPAYLLPTGVLLGAAALTKNEGLPLGLLLAVTLVLAAVLTRRRSALAPVLLVPVPLLAILPWKLWLSSNNLPQTTEFYYRDLLEVGYLADRLDRLSTALAEVPAYLLSPDRWLLAVPLALAAAILVALSHEGLAVLVAGIVVAGFLGQITIYWIGRPPIDWFIETSADRTLATLAVFSASLLPLLLSEALRRPSPN